MLDQLFKQGVHYASGSLLLSVASLISFPILTRHLSIDEYGYLSLLTTLSGLLAAIYKFGLQQSVVRYFKKGDYDISSNVMYSFLLSVFLVSCFVLIISSFIQSAYVNDLLYVVLAISVLQAFRSIVMGLYMSQQDSFYVNMINVLYKYGSLFSMLIFIFYYEKSAYAVITSILVTDILILIAISNKFIREFSFSAINRNSISLVALYGFPLMLVEVLQIGHAFTDRFLINYYLDVESVALYSAPHAISKIISDVIFGGVATALVPIYLSMWKDELFDSAKQFINKISDYFLFIFPISVAGMYVVSEPLMRILASDKYAESAYILPITFLGVGLFASTFIYSAGLKVKRNQLSILQYVFESLMINLILNLIFIEKYGIISAALTTVVSYLWMTIRFYLSSKHIINIRFNVVYLFLGIIVSAIILLFDHYLFDFENLFLDIGVKVIVSACVALIFLWNMSDEFRLLVNSKFRNTE